MGASRADRQSVDPSGECDVAVVGAGIVGLAVAREVLARAPDLRVTVLEREPSVGFHQTGHNSGVVHAGIYYAPGSLKARLCVTGARELYEYCDARGVRAERSGKLIIAVRGSELAGLDELERRGRANGVPGLRRLGPEELREIEPQARGIAALHSPATGIVDFSLVARAFADDVTAAGGVVATDSPVSGVRTSARRLELVHGKGQTRARYAVVCAGGWSDRLAIAAGASADPRVVPFRGAYLKLRPDRRDLVRSLIYPVPDPALPFLGVHLSRHPSGEVLIGPTSLIVGAPDAYSPVRIDRGLARTLAWPGTWRMARRFWRTGATELRLAVSRAAVTAQAARYVPALDASDLVRGWAGVRAQALARDGRLVDDFVVSETERALHVRNAPSPAATACLALARLIVDRVDRSGGLSGTARTSSDAP